MAAILYLDDGRPYSRSSIAVNNLLYFIADAMEANNSKLSRWLRDKGDRPAPFQDFDLRGLSPSDRAAFWEGAELALKRYEEVPETVTHKSYALGVLRDLMSEREKIVRGEPPPKVGPLLGSEDLNELWDAT